MKSIFSSLIIAIIAMANTCNPSEEQSNCRTSGLVVDMTGLDGCGLMIELEDGARLEPVSWPEDALELRAGQQILFDYEKADAMSICMAGQTVTVTCLEVMESPNTCLPVRVAEGDELQNLPTQAFQVLESKTEGTELHLKIGLSGCDVQRDFELVLAAFQTRSLPPQNPAALFFTAQDCEAYFEVELCFDLAQLKEKTVLNLINGESTEQVVYDPT